MRTYTIPAKTLVVFIRADGGEEHAMIPGAGCFFTERELIDEPYRPKEYFFQLGQGWGSFSGGTLSVAREHVRVEEVG